MFTQIRLGGESTDVATTRGACPAFQQPDRAVPDQKSTLQLLASCFSPAHFLVGVAFGFVICCIAGYQTTLKNQYGNIPRFGVFVGPQASSFPTVRQLIAYTRAQFKNDQILVLVGGSSVLNGVGQSNAELWTKKLQEKLGPEYAVVNLALRSCRSFEGAYFVAEALAKQHTKMIFVTSAQPAGCWDPIGMPPYAYLYWDAKYAGLLSDFPERDQSIAHSEMFPEKYGWTASALNELKLSEFLNSKFYFLDLWTTVGNRYFFTSYTSTAAAATSSLGAFAPRRKLPNDMEATEAFSPPDKKFAQTFFPGTVEGLFVWSAEKQHWMSNESRWSAADRTLRTNVAPLLRPRTLALMTYLNPYYRKTYLSKSQLQMESWAYEKSLQQLKSQGIRSVPCGEDYKGADFRDHVHFSPSGGTKLADQVAGEIKSMSKTLGYQ